MMRNFYKALSLLLIGLLLFFSFAPIVFAAESEAIITFTPGEGQPPVLDPTDPSEPYEPDPEDPTDPQDPPTGETGSLTLDFVSSVNFGENPIEAEDVIYESTTLRPFIQVTDRRGTGEGWKVMAQASNFTTVDEEIGETVETLTGAIITFTNGESVSTSQSDKPTPADPVTLHTGGQAATVVNATKDTGLGSWITRWFPSDGKTTNDHVTLEIPAGVATTGTHTATITWTLSDAP